MTTDHAGIVVVLLAGDWGADQANDPSDAIFPSPATMAP